MIDALIDATESLHAATDGPNDHHWKAGPPDTKGEATGRLHSGLGDASPTLRAPARAEETAQGRAVIEGLSKLSVAQQRHQEERAAFQAEVDAFKAQQAAFLAGQKKSK